jgi:hypothetical protein
MSGLQAQLLKRIGEASSNNSVDVYTMCVSKNGDIYVAGDFRDTLDIGGRITPIKDTNGNGFIAKYNSSLAPIGLRQLDIGPFFLATSSNGDLYATGLYIGTLSIGGIVTPIKTDISNGFLAKYNSDFTPSQLVSINSTEGSIGISVAISSIGDVYITGGYKGKLSIDSFTINSIGTVESNGFLAKYNRDLTLRELISIDSNEGSLGISLAISSNDDVYLTGIYDSTLTIGSFTINNTVENGFLAKFNSDLTIRQLVSIDSAEVSIGTSLAISTKGDVYLAGTFKGTLNIGGGITATSNNGAFIAKYNSDLTPNGLNYMIFTGDSIKVQTIKISSTGDVYVNGCFRGKIDIRNGTTATATENFSGFIVKYNSNLDPTSLNIIVNQTNPGDSLIFSTMALTLNDELYVSGAFLGTINIGDGVPTITIPDDIIGGFIAKYSIINNEPICVVAGTPIHTDQGIFAIERLDTTIHTIGRKRIVSITKAITPEKHLICFEEHSLAINCPTKRTIMTPGHEVLYKGKLVQAKQFLGKLDGVHTVPYDGKTVYNVLQEKHRLMVVNNMTVETLHPQNKVAKRILDAI